jgi:hypothetical protein
VATIVTSEGGHAITLATSGAGAITSFAGSEYTVATAAAASFTSKANSATGAHSFGFSSSVLTGLLTVIGGAFVGGRMVL